MKELDIIEKYISNQLSDAERDIFEQRMKDDKYFEMEVREHERLIGGVIQLGNRELKSKLKEISSTYSSKPQKRRYSIYVYVLALLILGLTILSIFLLSKPNKNQELYAQYYSPIKLTNTRGGEINEKVKSFIFGDYEQAELELSDLIGRYPGKQDLKIALANVYTNSGDNDKALRILQQVIQTKDPIFNNQAIWYSALIYLRTNDIENALKYFRMLSDSKNGDYSKESKALLERLN